MASAAAEARAPAASPSSDRPRSVSCTRAVTTGRPSKDNGPVRTATSRPRPGCGGSVWVRPPSSTRRPGGTSARPGRSRSVATRPPRGRGVGQTGAGPGGRPLISEGRASGEGPGPPGSSVSPASALAAFVGWSDRAGGPRAVPLGRSGVERSGLPAGWPRRSAPPLAWPRSWGQSAGLSRARRRLQFRQAVRVVYPSGHEEAACPFGQRVAVDEIPERLAVAAHVEVGQLVH